MFHWVIALSLYGADEPPIAEPKIIYPVGVVGRSGTPRKVGGAERLVYELFDNALPDYSVVSWPYNRAFVRYKQDPSLCLMGYDKELVNGELISDPVGYSEIRLYKKKDGPEKIKSIGMLRRATSFTNRIDNRFTYVFAETNVDLIQMVLRGRVDSVVLGSRSVELGIIEKHNLVSAGFPPATFTHRLHCHKTEGSKKLIERVNRVMETRTAETSTTERVGNY